MTRNLPMESAAMPIGPIHHRRDTYFSEPVQVPIQGSLAGIMNFWFVPFIHFVAHIMHSQRITIICRKLTSMGSIINLAANGM
jgi:hypothetical protein